MQVEIVAINRAQRIVLLKTGEHLPFATTNDMDGNVTDDPEDAVYAVFELPNGMWSYVIFADYEPTKLH